VPRGGKRSTSFRPGRSGNPGGRPKRPQTIEARKIIADVKAAAKELTQDALDTLKAALTAPTAPWAARVSAATSILDRGWGKPGQAVEILGEIEGALKFDASAPEWRGI
jgi:hypothetical protein